MTRRERAGRARDPEVEQRWRRHVTAWRERGVSAKVYCDEHGLSVPSLYAWRRKLAARDGGQNSGQTSPRFVAVDVQGARATIDESCIEIAPDGTIRIPAELDAERLATVLHVVRRARAC